MAVLAAVTASAYAAADRTTWTGEALIEDPTAECKSVSRDSGGARIRKVTSWAEEGRLDLGGGEPVC